MVTTTSTIEELYALCHELKNISGSNAKIEFLVKHKENEKWKKYLYYTLDSLLVYGIADKKLKKALEQVKQNKTGAMEVVDSIFDIFEYLKKNNTGRDIDALLIATYINNHSEKYHQWLVESITKSFKMGVTAKTVNKALDEELIFNFDVMLAHPFEKYAHKIKNETMFVTEKLDGNRATFIKENGKVTGFSRQGKKLEGYKHIEDELLFLPDNFVFDGELLIKDADEFKDREVMQQTQSVTGSKGDKTQLDLHLYDIIDLEGFKAGKSKDEYKKRRELLDSLDVSNLSHVKIVPILYKGTDLDMIMSILSEVEKEGKEGLMINLDGYYTLTRSNQILKLKTFNSFDEICTGVFEGEGKYKGMLGGITVNYKGFPLSVGSGFTDDDRIKYWNNPKLIIGKIVEVKYFRESKNKNGGLSVSFPVYQIIRDKNEVSYN